MLADTGPLTGVPATQKPALQTGYWLGHEESSTQGTCPPAETLQALSASAARMADNALGI
jgi:hypothetical protein